MKTCSEFSIEPNKNIVHITFSKFHIFFENIVDPDELASNHDPHIFSHAVIGYILIKIIERLKLSII